MKKRDPIRVFLESERQRELQDNLKLKMTKASVEIYYLLVARGHSSEITSLAFKICEETAEYEWGEGATLDDFSDQNFIIVTRKKRVAKIPKKTSCDIRGAA